MEDDDVELPTRYRPHDPRCVDGWLGEDADGRVIPCTDCRPHLARWRGALDRQLDGPRP